jgi:hypothetical protein
MSLCTVPLRGRTHSQLPGLVRTAPSGPHADAFKWPHRHLPDVRDGLNWPADELDLLLAACLNRGQFRRSAILLLEPGEAVMEGPIEGAVAKDRDRPRPVPGPPPHEAWYRRTTLAMLAHAYLAVTAATAPKALAAASSASRSARSAVSWHT